MTTQTLGSRAEMRQTYSRDRKPVGRVAAVRSATPGLWIVRHRIGCGCCHDCEEFGDWRCSSPMWAWGLLAECGALLLPKSCSAALDEARRLAVSLGQLPIDWTASREALASLMSTDAWADARQLVHDAARGRAA